MSKTFRGVLGSSLAPGVVGAVVGLSALRGFYLTSSLQFCLLLNMFLFLFPIRS